MVSKRSPKKRKKNKNEIVIRIPIGNVKKQAKTVGFAALVLLVLVLGFIYVPKYVPKIDSQPSYTGKVVSLDFYVMSQCPYGTQVEDAIASVLEKFGPALDFQMDFIARDLGNGNFDSLHGESEVNGNIAQLCANEHEPEEWMAFVSCMNKDAAAIPANWRTCSDQLGLDTDAIGECYAGEEGKQLLSESVARADEVGAMGSPTIYLNGELYSGGRQTADFIRAICLGLGEHPECADIEEIVKFEVIVLNDRRCTSCDTTGILQATRSLFQGAIIRSVDLSSAEGQELVSKYSIEKLPAYLFDSKVVDTSTWKTRTDIASSFQKVDDKYQLRDAVTGATYFVDETARKAKYDSLGITLGDNKPQIDFFVMSYCPYGNQAEEAIQPVLDFLGDKVELKPHYVIYSNYAGGGPDYCIDEASQLCSMHGIQELNQNLRERCVQEEYGIAAWFDFAIEMNTRCNYQNADTCWTPVAEELGYDTEKIQACLEANGEVYAREDLELGNLFGATGSPAVYIEGDSYSGPRTGAGFISAVCAKFDTPPEECNDIPPVAAPAPVPQGNC